ncbi:MAG: hypothetical protein LBG46_03265 [Elusimicrobiota bacterium]|jgi:hypothetical protein|nr:hypothetical protein [Elusimicrobiota bacterium]
MSFNSFLIGFLFSLILPPLLFLPSRAQEAADKVLIDSKSANPHQKEYKKETSRTKIKWNKRSSANFNVYMQPRTSGVPTPNLNMKFESSYQVLRQNIPWLMTGKADVYVYQSKDDFLKNEPQASSWSVAFFAPGENCIVMYDDPKDVDMLIRQFTHELTHLFVESSFNPAGKAYRGEPPIWLNEGIAVNMEDIASDYNGGVWADDLINFNIRPYSDESKAAANAAVSPRLVASAPIWTPSSQQSNSQRNNNRKAVTFKNFADFMRQDSYDKAVDGGYIEDWYFQAYAMVRFLFKPYNNRYPENMMQFRQFVTSLYAYKNKLDSNGKQVKDKDGRIVMVRPSCEGALKSVYGLKNAADFENKFWKWLYDLQRAGRAKARLGAGARANFI